MQRKPCKAPDDTDHSTIEGTEPSLQGVHGSDYFGMTVVHTLDHFYKILMDHHASE